MSASATDVQQVIQTSLTTPVIERMLITADRVLVQHIDPENIDGDLRDELQIWMAAHFLAIRDRQAKTQSADGVNFVMDGGDKEGAVGFLATRWGRQVLMLDPTGILAGLDGENGRLRFRCSNDRTDNEDLETE